VLSSFDPEELGMERLSVHEHRVGLKGCRSGLEGHVHSLAVLPWPLVTWFRTTLEQASAEAEFVLKPPRPKPCDFDSEGRWCWCLPGADTQARSSSSVTTTFGEMAQARSASTTLLLKPPVRVVVPGLAFDSLDPC
jgi:hypothetical protein